MHGNVSAQLVRELLETFSHNVQVVNGNLLYSVVCYLDLVDSLAESPSMFNSILNQREIKLKFENISRYIEPVSIL